MQFLDRIGKFLLGTFFLVISLSVLAAGILFYQWNPEHISKSVSFDQLDEINQWSC